MKSNDNHEAFYQDLAVLLDKHAGHLSGVEILAIASNMVGKIVALQDQRSITPAKAMEIVFKNIEMGNSQVIESLAGSGRTPQ